MSGEIVLLCGPAFSGKTTLDDLVRARGLEPSPDEHPLEVDARLEAHCGERNALGSTP